MTASAVAVAVIGVVACAGIASAQSPVAERSRVVAAPTGWFGVTLSNDGTFNQRGEVFFEGYPVVSEVEAGSPAAKAGVMPGDILMFFNSHDMRDDAFSIRSLLKAGAPFELKLRRNGAVREVRGTLGSQPEGWQNRVVIGLNATEAFESRTRSPARANTQAQRVVIRAPRATRVPPALIPAFTFGSGVYPFVGMEFMELNEDIRALLGVKPEGVFVSSVAENTPARISGLRGGDVLIQADDLKLQTPNDLVRAIAEVESRAPAEGRALRLRIIRQRKPQTLTLSW